MSLDDTIVEIKVLPEAHDQTEVSPPEVSQYVQFMARLEKPAPREICKSLLDKLYNHKLVYGFDSEITLCINEIEQSLVEAGTPISWAQLYCMAHVLNQEIIVLAPTPRMSCAEATLHSISESETQPELESVKPAAAQAVAADTALKTMDQDMETYLKDLDTCFASMSSGSAADDSAHDHSQSDAVSE
jgi:uncharacterized protein (DUF1778 family)